MPRGDRSLNPLFPHNDRGDCLGLPAIDRLEVLRVNSLLERDVFEIVSESVEIKTGLERHLLQHGAHADITIFDQEGTEESEVKGMQYFVSLAPGRLSPQQGGKA